MTARILQFPRNERILALGVMESITTMTGYAPRPTKPRVLARLGAYLLGLGIGGCVLTLLVQVIA